MIIFTPVSMWQLFGDAMTLNARLLFKFAILLGALLCTLLLTACAQLTGIVNKSDMPEWVQSEPAMYPNVSYLSATGAATEVEQAKAQALSNLAKIFEVRIREVSTTRSDIQTHNKEGIETVLKSQRMANTVNLKTDKMIQGVRIAEQWQNAENLTYHALAVLDRDHAGSNIRSEMHRLDAETAFALEQQVKRIDILLKISDSYRANMLQQDRLALQKTLKVIDLRGKGLPALWRLTDLGEQLQQALRSLPLQTVIKLDDVGGLSGMLQGAAAKAGFNPGDSGYQLAASLATEAPIKKGDWNWLRATLKLELIAQDGETVLGNQAWALKVSASDSAQLQARMRIEVDKKLQQAVLSSVLAFAL